MQKPFGYSLLAVLTLVISLLVSSSLHAEENNMVRNGSFEDSNGSLDKWGVWKASGNPTIEAISDSSIDGSHALSIQSPDENARASVYQDILVEAGESYQISEWIKLSNVQSSSKGAYIRISFYKADGQRSKEFTLFEGKGTTDWEQAFLTLDIPSNITKIRIENFLENGTGQILIDDVQVVPTTNILPTILELNTSYKAMEIDETFQAEATVLPENATNKEVTWTSSDNTVAEVNQTGLVKGLNNGFATITATTASGALTAVFTVEIGQANYILNGAFEDGDPGSVPPKWSTWKPKGNGEIKLVTDQVKEGTQSAYLHNTNPDDRTSLVQRVPIQAETTYALSYWMKTEDINEGTGSMAVRIQFKNETWQNTSGMILVGAMDGSNEWTKITKLLNVPKNTVTLSIEPMMDSRNGKAWIDDMQLVKVNYDEPPEISAFQATPITTGAVKLNWDVPPGYNDLLTYNIYRSAEEEFPLDEEHLLNKSETNEWIDTRTSLGATYFYKIEAIMKATEESSQSNTASVEITNVEPPSKPEAFSVLTHIENGAVGTWGLSPESRLEFIRIYSSPNKIENLNDVTLVAEDQAQHTSLWMDEDVSGEYFAMTVVDAEGNESDFITAKQKDILPKVQDEPINLDHPYLYFNENDIDELKAKIETEAYAEDAFKDLQKNADEAVQRTTGEFSLPPTKNNLHLHLGEIARDAGLVYWITEDAKYKEAAITIMGEYADHYPDYPLTGSYDGRLTAQTLEESEWLINIAWVYDMMYPFLDYKERNKVEENVLKNAIEVIDRYQRGLSNWQVWHNAAIGNAALVLKDMSRLDQVINDQKHGAIRQLSEGIRQDGLWWEGPSTYHEYAIKPLMYLSVPLYQSNQDLFHVKNGEQYAIKEMLDSLMNYAFGNMARPAIGNAAYKTLQSKMIYEIGFHYYQDPKYAWLIKQSVGENREGSLTEPWAVLFADKDLSSADFSIGTNDFAPEGENKNGSTFYRDSGLTIIRNHKPAEEAMNVSLFYSPPGTPNGHLHADKLGIMMYANSKMWLKDAGSLGYDNPMHVSWAKQTLAHNTLVVDQTSQYPQGDSTYLWQADEPGNPSSGYLKHDFIGPVVKQTRAITEAVYEGVAMERTTTMLDEYVLDWFHAESEDNHTYDLPFHIDGDLKDITVDDRSNADQLRDKGGYQHLNSLEKGISDELWEATYQKDDQFFTLTMLGEEQTSIYTGNVFTEMLMPRRSARKTDFVSVIQPYEEVNEKVNVMEVPVVSDQFAKGVTVSSSDFEDTIVIGNKLEQKKMNEMESDGAFAMTRHSLNDHKLIELSLQEGTYLSLGETNLTLDQEGSIELSKIEENFRIDYQGSDNVITLSGDLIKPQTKVWMYDEEKEKMKKLKMNQKNQLTIPIKNNDQFILTDGGNPKEVAQLYSHVEPIFKEQQTEPEVTGEVSITSAEEGVIVEGEDFVDQGGGEVVITPKAGASKGLALKNWDHENHWLKWKITVSDGGTYRAIVRYSTDMPNAYREFKVDEGQSNSFHFPSTYGWENWEDVRLDALDNQPLLFELEAGEHVIYMNNLQSPLNIDYIKLVKKNS